MVQRKKKPREKKKRRHVEPLSRDFAGRLAAIEPLLERRKWDEALPLLEALNRRYPHQADVLFALADVYYELQDTLRYLDVCEQLHTLRPNDPDITLMLAGAYMVAVQPVLALRTFRRVLQRWPDHPKSEEARKEVADLEAMVPRLLQEIGASGEDAEDLAARHEEVYTLLVRGKYPQARRAAEQLLQRHPHFAPALNNLGEAWYREGNIARAVEAARRVLESDPDNFHALSNLTRYLFLGGRPDEARPYAERLNAVRSPNPESWAKKAEAFSYLGDDQAVLEALRGFEDSGKEGAPASVALLYHLAAVAACRQGREDEARGHWRRALRARPGFDLAQSNLDDLDKPVGEQQAPWPFTLTYWIHQQTLDQLRESVERGARRRKESAGQDVRRFLEARPDVAALVPALLDRGDPAGRDFAARLADLAGTPELLAALRDFAFGRRGPDALRIQAANTVCAAGLVPTGPTKLWSKGEWRELLLLGWELHEEATGGHSPQVEQLAIEAMEATQEGDGELAERLLRQALEKAPNAPDLLNNLAAAYQAQGKSEESETLIREIHERFPDYFFGRAGLAQIFIKEGRLDEARELLRPLLLRNRLHRSEFAALCSAQIALLLADGLREGAQQWLDIWKGSDPEHPAIAMWEERLNPRGWASRLLGRRR
jgi:tetratricopeptide (TPR) repeat protein